MKVEAALTCTGQVLEGMSKALVPDKAVLSRAAAEVAAGGVHRNDILGSPRYEFEDERVETLQALGVAPEEGKHPGIPSVEIDLLLALACDLLAVDSVSLTLFDDGLAAVTNSEPSFPIGHCTWQNSLCPWLFLTPSPTAMVLEQPAHDAHISHLPWVNQIGTYIASPLIASNGHRLGSVCLLSNSPMKCTTSSICLLNNVAELVMRELERYCDVPRRLLHEQRLQRAYSKRVRPLTALASCLALVDVEAPGMPILYVNSEWERLTGYKRGELIHTSFQELVRLDDAVPAYKKGTAAPPNCAPTGACAQADPWQQVKAALGVGRVIVLQQARLWQPLPEHAAEQECVVPSKGLSCTSSAFVKAMPLPEAPKGQAFTASAATSAASLAKNGPVNSSNAFATGGMSDAEVVSEPLTCGLLTSSGPLSSTSISLSRSASGANRTLVPLYSVTPHMPATSSSVIAPVPEDVFGIASSSVAELPAITAVVSKRLALSQPASSALHISNPFVKVAAVLAKLRQLSKAHSHRNHKPVQKGGPAPADVFQYAPPEEPGIDDHTAEHVYSNWEGGVQAGASAAVMPQQGTRFLGCSPAPLSPDPTRDLISCAKLPRRTMRGSVPFDISFRPASQELLDDAAIRVGVPVNLRANDDAIAVQALRRYCFVHLHPSQIHGKRSMPASHTTYQPANSNDGGFGSRLTTMRDKRAPISREEVTEMLPGLSLQHVLGQGGYGTVYAGTWHGMDVAAKVQDFLFATCPPVDYAAAEHESNLGRRLQHSNLVKTYTHAVHMLDANAPLEKSMISTSQQGDVHSAVLSHDPYPIHTSALFPSAANAAIGSNSVDTFFSHAGDIDVPARKQALRHVDTLDDLQGALDFYSMLAVLDEEVVAAAARGKASLRVGSTPVLAGDRGTLHGHIPSSCSNAISYSTGLACNNVVPGVGVEERPSANSLPLRVDVEGWDGSSAGTPAQSTHAEVVRPMAPTQQAELLPQQTPVDAPFGLQSDSQPVLSSDLQQQVRALPSRRSSCLIPGICWPVRSTSHSGETLHRVLSGRSPWGVVEPSGVSGASLGQVHEQIMVLKAASEQEELQAVPIMRQPQEHVQLAAPTLGKVQSADLAVLHAVSGELLPVTNGTPVCASAASNNSLDGVAPPDLRVLTLQELCTYGSLQMAVDSGWFRSGVQATSPPNIPAAFTTLLGIARGLEYLHSQGIIHADLSAHNVLLAAPPLTVAVEGGARFADGTAAGVNDSQLAVPGIQPTTVITGDDASVVVRISHGRPGVPSAFVPKIADFGKARLQADGDTTILKGAMATVTHVPPEAMLLGIVGKENDVYAFGVICFQIWTGSRVWASMRHREIVEAVAVKGYKLQLPSDTIPAFRDMVMSCWLPAAERPTTAQLCRCMEALCKEYCH